MPDSVTTTLTYELSETGEPTVTRAWDYTIGEIDNYIDESIIEVPSTGYTIAGGLPGSGGGTTAYASINSVFIRNAGPDTLLVDWISPPRTHNGTSFRVNLGGTCRFLPGPPQQVGQSSGNPFENWRIGDTAVISGATNPENNGRYTIDDVDGADQFLSFAENDANFTLADPDPATVEIAREKTHYARIGVGGWVIIPGTDLVSTFTPVEFASINMKAESATTTVSFWIFGKLP